jgi:hypothetical protein
MINEITDVTCFSIVRLGVAHGCKQDFPSATIDNHEAVSALA